MNQNQLKALELIDNLKHNFHLNEPAFSRISKDDFLVDLSKLIEKPHGITQGIHPLCAIATLIKIASKLDPITLVKMAVYFYGSGAYYPKSFLQRRIYVSKKLRELNNSAGLTTAEYVLQSTIKAHFNPITGYNNKPGSLFNEWQGITPPFQIKNFLTSYFKIEPVEIAQFKHKIEAIQNLLDQPKVEVLAWTSWNQMVNPLGRFKILQQHYVLLKKLEMKGDEVVLTIDNPRKLHDKYQIIRFPNAKRFYKAIIGVYAFKSGRIQ